MFKKGDAMKKSILFLSLILLSAPLNNYGMKRLREEERSIPTGSRILLPTGRWVELVGEILLGEAQIKDLVHFTDLPSDVMQHIIYLLAENAAAQSLEDAAKNINNLALVNNQLNKLINEQAFCLILIKHLSQKFNCTDEEAAKTLQIKEAQRRLALQNKIYNVCLEDEPNIKELEQLFLEGADINFTYVELHYGYLDLGMELLLPNIYIKQLDLDFKNFINLTQWFINHGANKIQQNTLLSFIIEDCYEWHGNYVNEETIEIIKILLNANADPEVIVIGKDKSILSLMQETLNNLQHDEMIKEKVGKSLLENINKVKKIIKMLEDAIARKHSKK